MNPALVLVTALLCLGCQTYREPAYLYVFQAKNSPKGTREAVFYSWYPGGGDGFLGATVTRPLYIGIHPVGTKLDPEKDRIFAMRHAYQVHLIWKSDDRLWVEHPEGADVDQKETSFSGVRISYHPRKKSEFGEVQK